MSKEKSFLDSKIDEIGAEGLLKIFAQALKEQQENRESLRKHHIQNGFDTKAINTSDEGKVLYGTIWSLIAMEEYGFNDLAIDEVKSVAHAHSTDENLLVIYVWADSTKQAYERLGGLESGITGEVEEDGLPSHGLLF